MRLIFLPCLATIILLLSCRKLEHEAKYPAVLLKECAVRNVMGERVEVCFDSLLTDSRCPIGAVCIWQGEATVKLRLSVNGQVRSFHLSTLNQQPNYRSDTMILGYHVSLTDVRPYPGEKAVRSYVNLVVDK